MATPLCSRSSWTSPPPLVHTRGQRTIWRFGVAAYGSPTDALRKVRQELLQKVVPQRLASPNLTLLDRVELVLHRILTMAVGSEAAAAEVLVALPSKKVPLLIPNPVKTTVAVEPSMFHQSAMERRPKLLYRAMKNFKRRLHFIAAGFGSRPPLFPRRQQLIEGDLEVI